jgi:death-on-curing protein
VILLEEVLVYHTALIKKHGGDDGIRDEGLLLSALARPFMTFDQQDLYPTPSGKAAAIFESMVINHPFLDGNKRIAFFLLRLILLDYDIDILANEDEEYDFTIAASMGELDFDKIKGWIDSKLINIP